MTSAFWESTNVEAIGFDILDVIIPLRRCILFKELSETGRILTVPVEVSLFFNIQHQAEHHLLSLPSRTILSPIQECVRLTILISLFAMTMRFMPAFTFTRVMVYQLKDTLEGTVLSSSSPNLDLRLWVLFIGAHISKGLKERPWFVLQLARVSRLLGLNSVQQIKSELIRFVYLDWLHGQSLADMWDEISLIAQSLAAAGLIN